MKKRAGIITAVALVAAVLVCFIIFITIQNEKDKIFIKAHDNMISGKYDEAERLLDKIPNYNGASDLLLQVIYERGCSLFEKGNEAEAEVEFQKIKDYKNVKEYMDRISLHRAESYIKHKQYQEAATEMKNVSETDEMITFQDKLYRTWGESSFSQQDYKTSYEAMKKVKKQTDDDKELLHKATVNYAKELINDGKPDDAESMIQILDQKEDVIQLQREINDIRLAVTCIKDLQGRYTGENAMAELLEVRCAEQDYRGIIQIPIIMIRFNEKNVATGQVKEAFAIYDNNVFLLTCHSLIKETVDMKNATEMAGYLKLSQNWDNGSTIILSLNGIKTLLQM